MRRFAILGAAALLGVAAAPKPGVSVEAAQIRPPAGNLKTAAAYMTLKNAGDQPDRLVSASCACAAAVTLHQSVVQNGVSKMLDLKAVDVPAKGEVKFDASGRHLMLAGLKSTIKAGDTVSMVLTFEKAGKLTVPFAADAMAGMDMSGMHKPGTDSMMHHHQ